MTTASAIDNELVFIQLTLREAIQLDIETLFQAHAEELCRPAAYDYKRAHLLEDAGAYKLIGIFKNYQLVGYLAVFVNKSLHDDNLVLLEDLYYLAPEHRVGWAGVKVLREFEKLANYLGCTQIIVNSDINRPTGLILERLGYVKLGETYSKFTIHKEP